MITFDNKEKIIVPYGGILNFSFKKNRKNIEIFKRELKEILTLNNT